MKCITSSRSERPTRVVLTADRPYCGPSSNNKPLEFILLSVAVDAAKVLVDRNPVGWEVIRASDGLSMFRTTAEHTCKYCFFLWNHEHGKFCPQCNRFQ